MLERIRTQVGTAGLIVAIVALVAALGGGAYAATGGSGGGKATASAKGKQGPRGKTGKTGPAGPAGAAGPAGPAGPKGDTGAAGSNGANGTGVTGTPVSAGQEGCVAGGVKYTSASGTNVVCNGKNGTNGQTGFTETLPPGKTETGTWGLSALPENSGFKGVQIPISFPIPLAAQITETHVFEGETIPSGCTGRISEVIVQVVELGAEPGNLCIYLRNGAKLKAEQLIACDAETGEPFKAGRSGAILAASSAPEAGARAEGTWAVTAPEE